MELAFFTAVTHWFNNCEIFIFLFAQCAPLRIYLHGSTLDILLPISVIYIESLHNLF